MNSADRKLHRRFDRKPSECFFNNCGRTGPDKEEHGLAHASLGGVIGVKAASLGQFQCCQCGAHGHVIALGTQLGRSGPGDEWIFRCVPINASSELLPMFLQSGYFTTAEPGSAPKLVPGHCQCSLSDAQRQYTCVKGEAAAARANLERIGRRAREHMITADPDAGKFYRRGVGAIEYAHRTTALNRYAP